MNHEIKKPHNCGNKQIPTVDAVHITIHPHKTTGREKMPLLIVNPFGTRNIFTH